MEKVNFFEQISNPRKINSGLRKAIDQAIVVTPIKHVEMSVKLVPFSVFPFLIRLKAMVSLNLLFFFNFHVYARFIQTYERNVYKY